MGRKHNLINNNPTMLVRFDGDKKVASLVHSAELIMICLYPASANGIIVLLNPILNPCCPFFGRIFVQNICLTILILSPSLPNSLIDVFTISPPYKKQRAGLLADKLCMWNYEEAKHLVLTKSENIIYIIYVLLLDDVCLFVWKIWKWSGRGKDITLKCRGFHYE